MPEASAKKKKSPKKADIAPILASLTIIRYINLLTLQSEKKLSHTCAREITSKPRKLFQFRPILTMRPTDCNQNVAANPRRYNFCSTNTCSRTGLTD